MPALFTTALPQGPQLGWRSLPVRALLAGALALLSALMVLILLRRGGEQASQAWRSRQ
ncbi:hypothetical protein KIF53_04690 [Chromobacterium subtsugae]|uniref:Uncharacterized protein n=1 Tax=Chromobacterium subtsugae TaxID=251747 RepID=A0ABS7FAV2_9NEIS|nr:MULTISPECIES: hypothetical protein [Chromobacterium]MBW7566039.1 hypothetical protein [Chromobacterium subtsugae]MBW8286921.1 hypothetical protein [Chromobacterium subtsugae]WSE93001.1 hypothetical protein U6115_07095 [Chromobacterium subtsugae]WVH61379.1 hypothetical protein U6151_07115 [Chromobacterium subtsugae]